MKGILDAEAAAEASPMSPTFTYSPSPVSASSSARAAPARESSSPSRRSVFQELDEIKAKLETDATPDSSPSSLLFTSPARTSAASLRAAKCVSSGRAYVRETLQRSINTTYHSDVDTTRVRLYRAPIEHALQTICSSSLRRLFISRISPMQPKNHASNAS
jgi:hypothetical protein